MIAHDKATALLADMERTVHAAIQPLLGATITSKLLAQAEKMLVNTLVRSMPDIVESSKLRLKVESDADCNRVTIVPRDIYTACALAGVPLAYNLVANATCIVRNGCVFLHDKKQDVVYVRRVEVTYA